MNNLPSLTYSFCFQKNMNLNSPPSHFPMHHSDPLLPNLTPAISYHFFFDPTQDHTGFYDHHHLYRPNHVPDYQNYGGSTYEIKNKVDDIGLKLGLWKKENDEGESKINNPMKKWMSSKMRVMQKMKHTDQDHDEKVQTSSSDLSSNSSSYNNSPIRVCSDCNTIKTPLWRSGPNGPKSLCNACGIRQRKARRALAAAAAAAANGVTANTRDEKIKGKVGKNEHATQLKKRFKTRGKKQLGFEDFLINMSKNLAFHRVFPDEEKDAAILLMALSSGLVNG